MGIQKGTTKINNPDYEEKTSADGRKYYKKKEESIPASRLDNSTTNNINDFDDNDDIDNTEDQDEIYDNTQEEIEDLLFDHIDKGEDYFRVKFEEQEYNLKDFAESYAYEVAYNEPSEEELSFELNISYGTSDETMNTANSRSLEEIAELPENSTIDSRLTEINIPFKNIDDLKENIDNISEVMEMSVGIKDDYPVISDTTYQEVVDEENADYIAENWYSDIESFKFEVVENYTRELENKGYNKEEIERLEEEKEKELDTILSVESVKNRVINHPNDWVDDSYEEFVVSNIEPYEVIGDLYYEKYGFN